MLADMCNCVWVQFLGRVKPKHGKLAGCQHTASYPDDQQYRTVCGNFTLINSICDFFDSKMTMLLAYFSYILYKQVVGCLIQL